MTWKLKALALLVISLPRSVQADRVAPTRFYESFDHVRIHYEVTGKGEPVVLLHGFTGTAESWKRTALYTELVDAGFKVIVPDMRGNGLSDRPHEPEAYEKDAEARDIMGLAKHLKLRRYAVIGYSRGSIIASRLLVLDRRVSKAVLGGMGSDFTNPEWPRRILFYRALIGEPVPELSGFIKYVKDSGVDRLAMAYLQRAQPSTSRAELAAVRQPVLVISGDVDEDNGSSKELASWLPRSEYRRVPGDHNSTSRSEGFAEEVLRFIRSE